MSIDSNAGLGGSVNVDHTIAMLRDPAVKMDKLIQYTQGSNPLVPSYLALSEIQRRQDLNLLEPGQASTTTVAQDVVSKALAPQMGGMPGMTPQTTPQQAQQGVAGLQAPQGVAALPSGMGQQSFAGGGIVAFADGSKKAVEDPNVDDSTDDNAYLNRSRGLVEGAKNLLEPFTHLRNYDPLQKAGDVAANIRNWGQTPVGEQAAAFRAASMTPDQAPTVGGQTVLPSRTSKAAPSMDADAQAGGFYGGKGPTPAQFLAAHPNITNADVGTGAGAMPGPKASDAAKQLGITQTEAPTDMFGRYQKMYDEQKAQASADKEQSKWMRLLEAGLGIMGGTSPYAAVNIGQGATQAVKGAAADISANRKEQADANKELALIGMKQEELKNDAKKTGITEQHYKDWARLEQQKNGILAANGASSRAGIAEENRVLQAFKVLSAKPENMGKSEQELYSMARSMVTGTDQGGGSSTIAWNSLGKKS